MFTYRNIVAHRRYIGVHMLQNRSKGDSVLVTILTKSSCTTKGTRQGVRHCSPECRGVHEKCVGVHGRNRGRGGQVAPSAGR